MSELLRPGVAQGSYPERDEPRPGWFDRMALGVSARLRGGASHLRELRAVAKTVRGERNRLRNLGDRPLAAELDRTREALFRSGPVDALATPAFALVCEYSRRTLGMDPYDVQVMGGYAMLRGVLAEMQTGEGKTLTATLPACTAALAGIPVHVITVNDYLVERDAEIMGPLYRALGLRVGTVVDTEPDAAARRAAYAADVTYVTNKQIAFDYLRDRMVRGDRRSKVRLEMMARGGADATVSRLLLRGLCYAIIDEADSVLIDEARTPLILSQTVECSDLERISREALEASGALKENEDFVIDAARRAVSLTHQGQATVESVTAAWEGVWNSPRRREELIHQALQAQFLFRRDDHYLVRDGKVMIIDSNTGRVMPDRSWELGLHQMIEAKEGVELTGQRRTLARISYQQFYRRYLRLSGMTGTAREVRRELWSVYGLRTVRIPTHRPVERKALPAQAFARGDSKWQAVVDRTRALHQQGRPVLIGTRSVGESEALSAIFQGQEIAHEVLNARQDEHEAAIVKEAGGRGRITIATNMAGRGTDISLADDVREAGGLHVIISGRGDAGRIDRQLYGRCGRQGDPGSYQYLIAIDDDIATQALPGSILRGLCWGLDRAPGAFTAPASGLIRLAQRIVERRHAFARRQLLKSEEYITNALAFSGPGE